MSPPADLRRPSCRGKLEPVVGEAGFYAFPLPPVPLPPASGWAWRSPAGSTSRDGRASHRFTVWSRRTSRSGCESGPSASLGGMARRGRWSSGCCEGSCAVASSSMGTSSDNRYYHCTTPTPRRVTITRRHHPLQGLLVEVLHTGSRQLVVRAPDGFSMRLPRGWTAADGAVAQTSEADAVFSVDAIRALPEIVKALL